MGNYRKHFEEKRVTLMGLGRLGRGVGDARFLAEQGARLLVTDQKSEAELLESVRQLEGYDNISFRLGEHREEDFINADMVIKAAGVPLDSPYIAAAYEAGVPVTMSTALFAKYTPATIVGITGTRGKSTTTHLLADMLEHAGYNVFRGGNVKGVSTLAHLPDSSEDEIAVLELDSWQLQGFGYEELSPQISIFTTFLMDHMNYYAADQGDDTELALGMERYFQDKANIFRYQHVNDLLITSEQVQKVIQQCDISPPGRHTVVSAGDIPADWMPALPGVHNRLNIALAWQAADAFDVSKETAREAVEQFSGVEGRLQYVGEYSGVSVYNDTTATTPDATIAALNALGDDKKIGSVVLIAGGSDKGLPVGNLAHEIDVHCKAVIWLPGTGTDRVKEHLSRNEDVKAQDMQEAVEHALKVADTGDVILLSPAFASFGQFANEYERGERFLEVVQRIGNS